VEAAPGSLLSFRPICLGTNHAAATLSMTWKVGAMSTAYMHTH
jgi:hypothetical protein